MKDHQTLSVIFALLITASLYAAEGTASPNAFDGRTFTGIIKPDRDETAKSEPIALICKGEKLTAQWLADRGIREMHFSGGGFSGSHFSLGAETEPGAKPKASISVSADGEKKFSATLLIENEDLTNKTYIIEPAKK